MKRNSGALLRATAWIIAASPCWGSSPTLYSSPDHESPVRAGPDDLLLLSGIGFSNGDQVVYRAVDATTKPLIAPVSVPLHSTAALGLADIVSVADAPYSLAVHLPSVISQDQSYALWIVNSAGEWSNGVLINDARPLWITPNEVYSSAAVASLPRVFKVVGRNLQPAPNKITQVRLTSPNREYILPSANKAPDSSFNHYVAEIALPVSIVPDTYAVAVSRDGVSWVTLGRGAPVAENDLRVLPDPRPQQQFAVGDYKFETCTPADLACEPVRGKCLPDVGRDGDETICIAAAIAAARAAGGGAVAFGPGIWRMADSGMRPPGRLLTTKGVSLDGILVPDGVSLTGAGRDVTIILRGDRWTAEMPSFALQGHNTIVGFKFQDERRYGNADYAAPFLSLGVRSDRATIYRPTDPTAVSHVAITQNLFDRPFIAVGSGALSLDHIFVTNNIFGAFRIALAWEGNPQNLVYPYHFTDSVVAHNLFYPGSYLDTSTGQGTMATGLSGGSRIDFSNNVADGTSTAFFYDPQNDAKGWRAAYFWAMHDNVEMMLTSKNTATCTGDKDGDGEAIAYDNNHNRPGFASLAQPVLSAASDRIAATSDVTLQGSLSESQNIYGKTVDVRPITRYYAGDWLQIVQGPGIGQARKVTAIRTGTNAGGPTVTLTVTPPFDVLPQSNSLAVDGRIFWQTYTIGNTIDHRTPLCLKSNRTRRAGGLITLYAQTADSVIEGNSQFDTSGILIVQQFQLADSSAGIKSPGTMVQSFNEIRGNLVSGSYDPSDHTPQAEYGIAVGYGATPHTDPPPTLSYGISISHNTVLYAAAPRGAISFNQGWFTGPYSRALPGITPWKIADATLVFKNTLTDIEQSGSAAIGIGISADNRTTPIEWRTVLYGNMCNSASQRHPLVDLGTQTVRYCPTAYPESCECQNPPSELDISAKNNSLGAGVGSHVDFTVSVANVGKTIATGAVLSVEPSAGISIKSLKSSGARCNAQDVTALHCSLGDIPSGATATVVVGASITASGTERTLFSVTHHEADPRPDRNSVTVTIAGGKTVLPHGDARKNTVLAR
jgi:hypothetical protein